MGSQEIYQKDGEIRRRINTFLRDAFELPDSDYYGRLDLKNLLGLKSALSDINNAVTMRLTLGFLDWVAKTLTLDAAAASQLRTSVLATKPSSNGYDIHCAGPIPFIAEVKCNVPINGGKKYGAAQQKGILKDIDSLIKGKLKAPLVDKGVLKFMVFLDLPEVRAANQHLIASKSKLLEAFQLLRPDELPSNPDVVYCVYCALGS
jgi:hypothetical protein